MKITGMRALKKKVVNNAIVRKVSSIADVAIWRPYFSAGQEVASRHNSANWQASNLDDTEIGM